MKFTGLIIMDGYGINEFGDNNAISETTSPEVLNIIKQNPSTQLNASGLAVGLPDGQMGNSEVGHLNIGAGRVIFQDLPKISKAIEDGDFFANSALVDAMNNAKLDGKSLHIMGLLSNGGVHSHIEHLFHCQNGKGYGRQEYLYPLFYGRQRRVSRQRQGLCRRACRVS